MSLQARFRCSHTKPVPAPQGGWERGLGGVAIGGRAAIVRRKSAHILGFLPVLAGFRDPTGPNLMFITPAYAQAAAGGDANSILMSMLPFVLIFVIMYFLILRPQQKRVKDHAELIKNVRRGDTIITSGGIIAKITKVVDDEQIEIELADGVRARQLRSMISGVRVKGEPVKDDAAS